MQKKSHMFEIGALLHTIHKITQKWIKDLNVTTKITKLLEVNINICLHGFGLDSGFLGMTRKSQTAKEKPR